MWCAVEKLFWLQERRNYTSVSQLQNMLGKKCMNF